jgi:hypothetical protein
VKSLNRQRQRQQGLTIFGGVILLLFISAIALVIVRITPAYLENFTIKRIFNDLSHEHSLVSKEAYTVRNIIKDRLRQSGIHDQNGMKFGIKRSGSTLLVTLVYSVRRPIVGNLSAVMDFYEETKIGSG